MKLFNFTLKTALILPAVLALSGCAAGAATAGYAVKAHTADGLSSEAEQRVVDRVKRELSYEKQIIAIECQ